MRTHIRANLISTSKIVACVLDIVIILIFTTLSVILIFLIFIVFILIIIIFILRSALFIINFFIINLLTSSSCSRSSHPVFCIISSSFVRSCREITSILCSLNFSRHLLLVSGFRKSPFVYSLC